jgi:hypothetical protein
MMIELPELPPLDSTRPSPALDSLNDTKTLVRLLTEHVIRLQREVAAICAEMSKEPQ